MARECFDETGFGECSQCNCCGKYDEDYDWQDPENNPYLLEGEELDRAVEKRIKGESL